MKKSDYFPNSLVHALAVFAYVLVVALVLTNAKKIIGGSQPALLIPIFMLLLLIISATITGLLVLGKPIYLYLNGFKKEAIAFLLSTLAWLFLFLVAVIAVLWLR